MNDIIEEKIDIKKDNDNDISLTLNTNNIKNNSFYEGSINNISMIKTENNIKEIIEDDVHELCGEFAAMIVKGAIAKDSSDNVS